MPLVSWSLPLADDIAPELRRDRVLLDLLADKWTLLVLGSLCDHGGVRRFNAIKRDIPDISQRSLSFCLRRLERNGLVRRRIMEGRQIGVEYSFTALGLSLDRPVASLLQWTSEHADAVRDAQQDFDGAPD
jgi:DNA-binding HxlR family transcriptional regulator